MTDTTSASCLRIARQEGFAPLIALYSDQTEPQPAYLELAENGHVHMDWSRQVGDEVLVAVWHKHVIRWSVPHGLSAEQCNALLMEIEPLLETVYLGHEVDYDGSRYLGTLTQDAEAAREAIEAICDNLKGDISFSNGDWLGDDDDDFGPDEDTPLTARTTDEDIEIAADRLDELAQGENVCIGGDAIVAFLKNRRERLREEVEA